MRLFPARPDRFHVVVYAYATAALLAAALLVIYLQHRAWAALDQQTRVILRQVSEQAATNIQSELRRVFEGPVFEILTAVNHPELQRDRLDLVATQYARGLREYPHVERFFVWSTQTQQFAPGEVLFYGRDQSARGVDGDPAGESPERSARSSAGSQANLQFQRDPALGRLIYRFARESSSAQQIYAAVEQDLGDARYDILVRLFWTDARRQHYFALLGFVTNLQDVRSHLLQELYRRRLAALLDPGGGSPRLEMRILDETGRQVFASGEQTPSVTARSSIDFRFYPATVIHSRMAAEIPKREWSVVVGPTPSSAAAALAVPELRGYWLLALSVLLMLTGLFFAVQGYERARQLARMQADFISHVSHHLKTPLSLLSGVCETLTLDRARSRERQVQYLDIMRTEMTRVTALVERILEFSRVDGGRRTYEPEPVEIGPLVRETVEAFRGGLADDTIRIKVEEDGPSPVVFVDPAALEQALVNLLDNAVKYSDRIKEINVRVSRSNAQAIIEVTDRGIGIADRERGRVFEKFYRGAGASLHRHGFGLGLAIVRELIQAHRGRIEVDSRPGRGSTFRISLPMAQKGLQRTLVGGGLGQWLSRLGFRAWDEKDVRGRSA